ncbi:MAG TPA: hypothetical protein VEK14_07985, partial [Rhodomicrobium sp.]|nr:hypothetical protein [Rhodomicrobium sp.]
MTTSDRGRDGLALLQRAASIAGAQEEPDFAELRLLREGVQAGLLEEVSPSQAWPEIAECLMARSP